MGARSSKGAQRPAVACFVTPHGFGHAARAAAVLAALRERVPGLAVHLFTTVTRWFFRDSLGPDFTLHRLGSDVGLVQRDPLSEDLPATVAHLSALDPPVADLVEHAPPTLPVLLPQPEGAGGEVLVLQLGRAVDLFSDKEIALTGDKEPYLLGLVLDQQNKPIRSPDTAEAYAAYLLTNRSGTRVVEQEGGTKQATYVTMKMVAKLSQKQAEKYRPLVQRFSEQYKISPSLVFAVIGTESNFNPYAVSSAPGLRPDAAGSHERGKRSLSPGERERCRPFT